MSREENPADIVEMAEDLPSRESGAAKRDARIKAEREAEKEKIRQEQPWKQADLVIDEIYQVLEQKRPISANAEDVGLVLNHYLDRKIRQLKEQNPDPRELKDVLYLLLADMNVLFETSSIDPEIHQKALNRVLAELRQFPGFKSEFNFP